MRSDRSIPDTARLTESEMARRLRSGDFTLQLPPARLCFLDFPLGQGQGFRADGIVEAAWQEGVYRFVCEFRASNTPKALENAIPQAQRVAERTGLLPLIVVPFLSEASLRLLEAEKVSGIDLSGNGILVAPGMAIWRSGQPQRYKDSQPIRNVFRGTSSILSRCFLLRKSFASLVELRVFALDHISNKVESDRETLLTKGTVSKVVRALYEEKIIVRSKETLQLAAPQLLMERLKNNYSKPRGRRLEGKMPYDLAAAWDRLNAGSVRYVATGDGSAGRYGLLSGPEKISLYVEDFDRACDLLDVTQSRVFPNIEIVEEKGEVVYFDARIAGAQRWASPIQVWLELTLSGPREREAAQTLEDILLRGEADTLI